MNFLKNLYYRLLMEIQYRKRLRAMRKRDPFIYK
jgi:hypothetical protein